MLEIIEQIKAKRDETAAQLEKLDRCLELLQPNPIFEQKEKVKVSKKGRSKFTDQQKKQIIHEIGEKIKSGMRIGKAIKAVGKVSEPVYYSWMKSKDNRKNSFVEILPNGLTGHND